MHKKILHVCGFGTGGIQNVVYSICSNSNASNFTFYIFGKDLGEENNIDRYKKLGAHIIMVPNNASKSEYLKIYKNAIRDIRPDCVHLHQMYASGIMAYIAKRLNIKQIIVQAHNTNTERKNTLSRRIYKTVMRQLISACATNYVAVSKNAGIELFGKNANRDKRYKLILNGIDMDKYERSNADFKHPFFDHKHTIIACIGRLVKQKNTIFAIRTMSEIVKLDNSYRMIIAGDGDLREELVDEINKLHLQKFIDIIGFTNNVPGLLHKSNLLLFPSLWEGFPLTLIEAQVSGTPCLTTDLMPEEANIGLVEFYSLKNREVKWAKKVVSIVNNKSNYKINDKKKEDLSIDHMVREYVKLYQRKGEK